MNRIMLAARGRRQVTLCSLGSTCRVVTPSIEVGRSFMLTRKLQFLLHAWVVGRNARLPPPLPDVIGWCVLA